MEATDQHNPSNRMHLIEYIPVLDQHAVNRMPIPMQAETGPCSNAYMGEEGTQIAVSNLHEMQVYNG